MKDFVNGYFQREPADGITVYYYDPFDGKIHIYREFDSWVDFIRRQSECDINKRYRNQLYDNVRVEGHHTQSYLKNWAYDSQYPPIVGPCVAYWNKDGALYPTDQIIGDIRNCPYKYNYNWRGYKLGNWRGYRRPKLINERKQWKTWDNEYPIKVRARRNAHTLMVDPWGEFPRQQPTNWKDSTKRKHQWKDK